MTDASFHVSRYAAVRLSITAGPVSGKRVFPVQVLKVNQLAYATALRLAGGDAGRLLVLDELTIIVANRSRYAR